jgi:hypothetical protein
MFRAEYEMVVEAEVSRGHARGADVGGGSDCSCYLRGDWLRTLRIRRVYVHPGGMADGSRGLSEATPPVGGIDRGVEPGGFVEPLQTLRTLRVRWGGGDSLPGVSLRSTPG